MDIIEIITKMLAVLVAGSQIFIALSVLYLLFFRKKYPFILNFFADKAVLLSFLVALTATSGSLFFSNYIGLEPCELCWLQRIFMYPLAVIFLVALLKKETDVFKYSFWLSLIGFAISSYQNYLIYEASLKPITSCTTGGAVSCTAITLMEFGYITIPVMALTAFLLLITLWGYKKLKN